MLKNAVVSKVLFDYEKGICSVYMENGDIYYSDRLEGTEQVREYLKMLQEEDGLIIRDDQIPQEAEKKLQTDGKNKKPVLRVQCFGTFEVFCNEKPLYFERKGAKEIFAVLIDKRGASATRLDICSEIWEDDSMIERRKTYFRTLIMSLRNTLKSYGMEDVFISRRDEYAVNMTLIDCDYYRFLNGDTDMSVKFRGEYMSQYSWAETTLGQLIEETGFSC